MICKNGFVEPHQHHKSCVDNSLLTVPSQTGSQTRQNIDSEFRIWLRCHPAFDCLETANGLLATFLQELVWPLAAGQWSAGCWKLWILRMVLDRLKALTMLSECTGDDIWSLEHCRQRSVPSDWVTELADGFESNMQRDSETIYVNERITNQYEGVRDVDLAIRLGEYLGIQVDPLLPFATTRANLVRMIKEAVEES